MLRRLPFSLQEGQIIRVSDELFDYVLNDSGEVIQNHHTSREIEDWAKKADKIENFYSKRPGIIIGPVESFWSTSTC